MSRGNNPEFGVDTNEISLCGACMELGGLCDLRLIIAGPSCDVIPSSHLYHLQNTPSSHKYRDATTIRQCLSRYHFVHETSWCLFTRT